MQDDQGGADEQPELVILACDPQSGPRRGHGRVADGNSCRHGLGAATRRMESIPVHAWQAREVCRVRTGVKRICRIGVKSALVEKSADMLRHLKALEVFNG